MLKMIFACGPEGQFGFSGGLPWELPEDLQLFKTYTKDCVLLMSGATFESLPGKLPGRKHAVLSDRQVVTKNGSEPDYLFDRHADPELVRDVLEQEEDGADIALIGGSIMLSETFLHLVEDAQITVVNESEINGWDKVIDDEFIMNTLDKVLTNTGATHYEGFHVLTWVRQE